MISERASVRWQDGEVGELKALLEGHTGIVSFVDFCPTCPKALLSSSFDGTCRVWNATDAAVQPLVLSAASPAAFAGSGAPGGGPSAAPSLQRATRSTDAGAGGEDEAALIDLVLEDNVAPQVCGHAGTTLARHVL